MTVVRMLALVSLGVMLSAAPAVAQSLSSYRAYALGSPLSSWVQQMTARTI